MKKWSLLLSLVLFISILSGCDSNKNNTPNDEVMSVVNPEGVFPISDKLITLSAFVVQTPRTEDLRTNEATLALEAKTNIALDMIVSDPEALIAKRDLLMASGDYPDIFMVGQFTNTDIMNYGVREKRFLPLNDYIDAYGTSIRKAFDEVPGLEKAMTAPDGNIYGIPNTNLCYHCSMAQKMYLNFAWLEALNLEIPETTEDYYQVLKAFKEQDPNGNGIADEIPLTGTPGGWYGEVQHFIMNAFIYDDGKTYFQVVDDDLEFVADKEGWREGLRYMNTLYLEGLIDPAAFTQTNDQVKHLAMNDLVGSVPSGFRDKFLEVRSDNDLYSNWQLISPLEGPSGIRVTPVYPGVEYGAHFVITDKCENPEVAFRLVEFLYSEEGTLLMEKGVEGLGWISAIEGELNILGEQAKYKVMDYPDEVKQNRHWDQFVVANRSSEIEGYRGMFVTNQDPDTIDGIEKHLFEGTKKLYEPYKAQEYFTSVFIDLAYIDELEQIEKNLMAYITTSMTRFIVGDLDVDGDDWTEYLNGLNERGVDRYIELYNQGW